MKHLGLVSAAISVLLIGCATKDLPTIEISPWAGTMKIIGDKYRYIGSSSAVLGSYGQKLKTVGQRYQLDGLFIEQFKTTEPRIVDLSFDNLQQLEKLGITLTEEVEGNIGAKRAEKGNYKLVVIRPYDPSIFEKELIRQFQSDSFLRNKMKNPSFRYIDSVVFMIDYDATETTEGSVSGGASLNRITKGFKLEIAMSQNKKTVMKLPDKQVIAYQYRRLCWKEGKMVGTVKDILGAPKGCSNGGHEYPGKVE